MIEWETKAVKEVKKIPKDMRQRIFFALDKFDSTGQGDVKKLKGMEFYRLRVGDYRVIFEINKSAIRIIEILRRSEGYR